MRERYLRSLRLLAECMQGFERYSSDCIRTHGLTGAQFDIIATLGNTPGMPCKELGEKTLITKGTLTGVLNRLEEKGLLERTQSPQDKRSIFVRLTRAGEQVFATVFPQVIAHHKHLFEGYGDAEFGALEAALGRLKDNFERYGGG